MHPEAFHYVASTLTGFAGSVLDIGGRDVNGTPRSLLAGSYYSVDAAAGPNVDEVVDARSWRPDRTFDAVLCLEVFEHVDGWRDIVRTARACLDVGGVFVVTAASDPRAPHSAGTGGPLARGEWYENVPSDALGAALTAAGFTVTDLSTHPRGDVYATAVAA